MTAISPLTLAGIDGSVIAAIAIIGGIAIALSSIIFNVIARTAATKEREQTRRELAAYVAEGSIRPEDAERILSAGEKGKHRNRACCNARNSAAASTAASAAAVASSAAS